ncbi:MAG TPA: bifunctional precorrin-2 dehydrogenase/sirohydrochlorin ferrochelatase [Nitrospirae bacterium]|nr:bifunctional precorrin-2 dehydrogenase/sirohydrochlorin ferrochelatase [Nitrospirota bacterium]
MKYYPIFLNLKAKKAVVVGGGIVAERKAITLVKAGASVHIISPRVTKALRGLIKKGVLTHIKRNYKKGDLKNAFIVIAGTSSPDTNTKISQDAGHLINVIDTPSEGNFIAPSLVRRGPLTIAISTEGCSPAASMTIRKELEKLYGKEFTRYLRLLEQVRTKAMKEIKDAKKREKFLKGLASKKIFNNLRKQGQSSLPSCIK